LHVDRLPVVPIRQDRGIALPNSFQGFILRLGTSWTITCTEPKKQKQTLIITHYASMASSVVHDLYLFIQIGGKNIPCVDFCNSFVEVLRSMKATSTLMKLTAALKPVRQAAINDGVIESLTVLSMLLPRRCLQDYREYVSVTQRLVDLNAEQQYLWTV
jgi:hypothetical protein